MKVNIENIHLYWNSNVDFLIVSALPLHTYGTINKKNHTLYSYVL